MRQSPHRLSLLMGLLAAGMAHAQDASSPSTSPAPSDPATTAPAPAPAPPPAPAGGGSGPAGEEPTPFIFGIRQSLTGDSNLFRASDDSGLVRRDRIWSSGLHLGVDKSLGRQHFNVDLQGNVNRYNKNTYLNNTDYAAAARWDWETVERISGELSASQRESLFRDSIAGVVTTERNELRTTALAFQARVGLVTRWSFEGGLAASENDYTGSSVDIRDVRQTTVNAGLRYRPSSALSTRLGVRRSEGRYPRFVGESDDFTRDDVDLSATFDASGASRLNTRISATREHHSLQDQRDTTGWTGALGWLWRPTGKLSLDVDLSSDRSVGRSGFDTAQIVADTSDAREAQMASLALTWAATAKISFVPRVSYVQRKLDNSFTSGGSGGTLVATDRTTNAGVTMNYQPFQALSLICQISREQRRVSGAPGLTSPYDATVAGCTGELALR